MALADLEEDEHLLLQVKGTHRYVQFMDQGGYGMRAATVSDYYLPEGEHLGEADYRILPSPLGEGPGVRVTISPTIPPALSPPPP